MNIITLSEAKPQMGRLVDSALRGESVLIRKGNRVVQLTEYVMPEPIPVRPAGYFGGRCEKRALANRAPANQAPQR